MWNPLKFALMNIKGQQENMIWELRLLYSLCDNNKINIIYEDENLSLTRLIIVRTTLTKISLMFICLVPFSWFRIPDSRFRIPGSGFQVPDSRFRIPDSRFSISKSLFPYAKSNVNRTHFCPPIAWILFWKIDFRKLLFAHYMLQDIELSLQFSCFWFINLLPVASSKALYTSV